MAQLPPKIPNMTPNWTDISHQKLFAPNVTSSTGVGVNNPSWVDEFLDFSTARRGSHRRSVSDSITFLEAPILDECRGGAGGSSVAPMPGSNNEFDRFDDEHFMSMFNDEVSMAVAPTVSSSNTSSPSDHNSINDEKDMIQLDQKQRVKNESEEVDSQCNSETQANPNATTTTTNTSNDKIIDPKRVKR